MPRRLRPSVTNRLLGITMLLGAAGTLSAQPPTVRPPAPDPHERQTIFVLSDPALPPGRRAVVYLRPGESPSVLVVVRGDDARPEDVAAGYETALRAARGWKKGDMNPPDQETALRAQLPGTRVQMTIAPQVFDHGRGANWGGVVAGPA